ncbi:hypothetical protein C8R44DRAFT_755282 [Mycena epipterygia]|nr:hypothetical protein C8R44DRAFT_755282 [Mycena epipterygia]
MALRHQMQSFPPSRLRHLEIFTHGGQASWLGLPILGTISSSERLIFVSSRISVIGTMRRAETLDAETGIGARQFVITCHSHIMPSYFALHPEAKTWESGNYEPYEPAEHTWPVWLDNNRNVCAAFDEEYSFLEAFGEKYPEWPPCAVCVNQTKQFLTDLHRHLGRFGACDGVLRIREHIRLRDLEEERIFAAAGASFTALATFQSPTLSSALELSTDQFFQAWDPWANGASSWGDNSFSSEDGVWGVANNDGWGNLYWPNYSPMPYPPVPIAPWGWGIPGTFGIPANFPSTGPFLGNVAGYPNRCRGRNQAKRLCKGRRRSMGSPFLPKACQKPFVLIFCTHIRLRRARMRRDDGTPICCRSSNGDGGCCMVKLVAIGSSKVGWRHDLIHVILAMVQVTPDSSTNEILAHNKRVASWIYNDRKSEERNRKKRERMTLMHAAEGSLPAEICDARRQHRLEARRRYRDKNREVLALCKKERCRLQKKQPQHQERLNQQREKRHHRKALAKLDVEAASPSDHSMKPLVDYTSSSESE